MKQYTLTREECRNLSREIVGQGGMQNLMRSLQNSINHDTLRVNDKNWDTLCRYLLRYGFDGGWQGMLPESLRYDVMDELTTPEAVEEPVDHKRTGVDTT